MRYFLIAGEASGDLHAGELIDALRSEDSSAEFQFIGGDKMANSANCTPLIHYKDMAFMGFVEVIKHLPQITHILKEAKAAIKRYKPDAVILIDYPSFNMNIAKFAHKLNIPVYYYIAPKVWAWKEWRVKSIRKYVKRLFSILPFEREFFNKHNYSVTYVGNPSVEQIRRDITDMPPRSELLESLDLNIETPLVTIMPGSRLSEIKCNLPEMLRSVSDLTDIQVVIAGAPAIEMEFYNKVLEQIDCSIKPKIIFSYGYELLKYSVAALVTSGTATLETAIIGTPQVVCYRGSGSKFTYNLFKRFISVSYVALPNLIADKLIIPELLMHHCTTENIKTELTPLLTDTPKRRAMLDGYATMNAILGDSRCSEVTATEIWKDLNNNKQL